MCSTGRIGSTKSSDDPVQWGRGQRARARVSSPSAKVCKKGQFPLSYPLSHQMNEGYGYREGKSETPLPELERTLPGTSKCECWWCEFRYSYHAVPEHFNLRLHILHLCPSSPVQRIRRGSTPPANSAVLATSPLWPGAHTLSWSKPNPRNVQLKFLPNSPTLASEASPTQTTTTRAS